MLAERYRTRMSKLLKTRMAQELKKEVKKFDSFIAFNYQKATARQMYELREYLRKQRIRIMIIKNRIASFVFTEVYRNPMKELMKGPVAIAYGGESAADIAKALLDWNRKQRVLQLKGGCLANKMLKDKEVEALSKIPPKPVLLSMMAGSFKSPLGKIPAMFNASTQKLAYAFQSVVEKMEKQTTTN